MKPGVRSLRARVPSICIAVRRGDPGVGVAVGAVAASEGRRGAECGRRALPWVFIVLGFGAWPAAPGALGPVVHASVRPIAAERTENMTGSRR
jgi:hypothetical protein